LNLAVGDAAAYIDRVDNAISFTIDSADIYQTGRLPARKNGLIALEGRWHLSTDSVTPAGHDSEPVPATLKR
jgi:hypothetical protein